MQHKCISYAKLSSTTHFTAYLANSTAGNIVLSFISLFFLSKQLTRYLGFSQLFRQGDKLMTESVIALVQPIFFTRNKHKSLIQQEQAIECNYFFFFQHSKSVFLTIILPPKLLFFPFGFPSVMPHISVSCFSGPFCLFFSWLLIVCSIHQILRLLRLLSRNLGLLGSAVSVRSSNPIVSVAA